MPDTSNGCTVIGHGFDTNLLSIFNSGYNSYSGREKRWRKQTSSLSEKLFVILYYIISLSLSYKTTDYNSIYKAKTSKENSIIRNKYRK
jgi:hypothetical protein